MSLSRSDRKALSGIRIVDQLKSIGLETIMSTTASPVPPSLALQGALYTCRTIKSPMAQLTSFKSALALPAPTPAPAPDLGVPGKPGSGALRDKRPPRKGTVRPDLGTVLGSVPTRCDTSTLGTIGTMLFGRKGGLL